jgi:hypothetical protein
VGVPLLKFVYLKDLTLNSSFQRAYVLYFAPDTGLMLFSLGLGSLYHFISLKVHQLRAQQVR